MYSLTSFCSVCLQEGEELQAIDKVDFDKIKLVTKLNYCALDNDWDLNDVSLSICNQCCHILRLAYNFKRTCIKNTHIIRGYLLQLKSSEPSRTINLQNIKDSIRPNSIPNSEPIVIECSPEEPQIVIKEEFTEDQRYEEDLEYCRQELLKHLPPENSQKIKAKFKDKFSDIITIEDDITPDLTYQEKSSTQTLTSLKQLVGDTNSSVVAQLKNLVDQSVPKFESHLSLDSGNQNNRPLVVTQPTINTIIPSTSTVQAVPTTSVLPIRTFECIFVPGDPDDPRTIINTQPESTLPIVNNINEHYDDPDEKYCKTCDKYFPRKSAYRRHAMTHSESDMLYKCNLCLCKFSRKDLLKKHIDQHTAQKVNNKEDVDYTPKKFYKKHYQQMYYHPNKPLKKILPKPFASSTAITFTQLTTPEVIIGNSNARKRGRPRGSIGKKKVENNDKYQAVEPSSRSLRERVRSRKYTESP